MPAESKPLFRPEALKSKLANFVQPVPALIAAPDVKRWAKNLAGAHGDKFKETEQLPEFIADIFGKLLGYTGRESSHDLFTLRRENLVEVDGKRADAAFGQFDRAGGASYSAVLEGKGPRDPLDRPFAGRSRSAVEQALQYAVNLEIDWFLVTNFREIRLYHKSHDLQTYERFEIARLADDDGVERRRFVFLLGADRVVGSTGNHLDDLLVESVKLGRELTNDFYKQYAEFRREMFTKLCDANPKAAPTQLLGAAQKILDRILFISFAEDRGLLPGKTIDQTYAHKGIAKQSIWKNFRDLFQAVNEGNSDRGIEQYNGGLFAEDKFLDSLKVPDEACRGFKRLADWEYSQEADKPQAKFVDVEILGHIFEQSISDLEEFQKQLESGTEPPPAKTAPSKRKKEGAFYTPAFVTRYIVQSTLGPVLADRFERYRASFEGATPKGSRTLISNPRTVDATALKAKERQLLTKFWNGWHDELQTIRIVDPACGSGAFLIEAFQQLLAEYSSTIARIHDVGGAELFDVDREILESNLFGMDLNSEAIEICRLSLWIKTARKGKVLTNLDQNIIQGNSIVAEGESPTSAWRRRFPAAFADAGFDVVIGNPPYVRQEWIAKDKPYLQQHYWAFDGVADLYVYFYELGLSVLKPGGRLGFIVTNKWMKAGYGEALRKHFGSTAWVESVVDFGHAKQIFPDADVFPSILVARKPTADPAPSDVRVCVIPREQLRIDDLNRQIDAHGVAVPRKRLGSEPWNLEPHGVGSLLDKMKRSSVPLKQFAGVEPLSGIKTGLNDAFLIDTETKDRLLKADAKSSPLFKRYLSGQNIQRWQSDWSDLWMLAIKSSGNFKWPWSGLGEKAEPVFANTYPSLHNHLNQYRDALIKRQDQGENWWELRACAYWDQFERPKIIYPEITWHLQWCLDQNDMYINNTAYILPSDDLWIVAVANSPASWWYAWRNAMHGKDEALRYIRVFVQELPIPEPSEKQRRDAEKCVKRLWDIAARANGGRVSILDWLRHEYDIEKPSQKLADVATLDADGLITEVKKVRGKKQPLTVAGIKQLKDEHAKFVVPLQELAREAQTLERRVADLVNEAYGLTPDEVALMWQTAPPRMPVGRG